MSIPIKESATIAMICDDTLGGYTSIDSRKFAEEFLRRRASDTSENNNAAWVASTTSKGANPVAPEPSSRESTTSNTHDLSLANFADDNKFVIVQSSKKKKKKSKK